MSRCLYAYLRVNRCTHIWICVCWRPDDCMTFLTPSFFFFFFVTVFHWDLGLDWLFSQPRDPPVPCWDCSCTPLDPDFIYFNHIAFIKACVCVYKGYMWRSKDNPWQPALAFHPMCSGDGSRDIRLDCRHLYPPSHLTSPQLFLAG